jgi:chitin synthase
MPPQSLAADLTILPISTLTDHALTSHIASRFHQGLPYVTISSGTLIALNTFQPFDINQDQVFKDLAARVYNRLCKRGESQVVLFLGESGSGKSEFRHSLTSHLLSKCTILKLVYFGQSNQHSLITPCQLKSDTPISYFRLSPPLKQ